MTHDFKKFPELTNSQMALYYFDSPHQQITENFIAKVEKVHDGDTIRVSCDFRNFDFPIRFSNIMAAELNEEGGRESQQWLENKIKGEMVEVVINENKRVGKWGRLLGRIIHNGFDMGEMSKAEGKSIGLEEERIDLTKLLILKSTWD